VPRSGVYSFSITSGKDVFFRLFVIPANPGSSPGEIQADFELFLDSGFRRNDVMPQNFLRSTKIKPATSSEISSEEDALQRFLVGQLFYQQQREF